ncbi:MAG: HEAT repeat domain-containing protein [Nitrospirae bacterium]|nr:HEAT repeat domain-containing protein [Nitrospirota bacterium]
MINRYLEENNPFNYAILQKPHYSMEWSAIEELLINKKRTFPDLTQQELYIISRKLGYTEFYLAQLKDGAGLKKAFAAEQLGRMGAVEAVPFLIKALYDKNLNVRIGACRALAHINNLDCTHALIEKLIQALDHSNDLSLRILIPAILRKGSAIEETLLTKFDHSSGAVRSIFTQLLVETAHPGLLSFFIKAALDSEPEVRAKAIRGLSKIHSDHSVSTIIGLISDPLWFVRLQAVKAIGELKHPRFYPIIWRGLTDFNWQVRTEAGKSLMKISVEALHLVSNSEMWPQDRFAKEQIFEELQRSGYIVSQIKFLESESQEEKKKALRFLEMAMDFGVISILIDSALHHPNFQVRLTLLKLLSKKNDPRVKEFLKKIVKHESVFEVYEEAKRLLKNRNRA